MNSFTNEIFWSQLVYISLPKFFLNEFLENKVDNHATKTFRKVYEQISLNLLNQPKVICHYDFECRNLVYKENKTGVLDFQDALIGPIGLDLASLFKDLYFFWPEEKIFTWYENYQRKIDFNQGIKKIYFIKNFFLYNV